VPLLVGIRPPSILLQSPLSPKTWSDHTHLDRGILLTFRFAVLRQRLAFEWFFCSDPSFLSIPYAPPGTGAGPLRQSGGHILSPGVPAIHHCVGGRPSPLGLTFVFRIGRCP